MIEDTLNQDDMQYNYQREVLNIWLFIILAVILLPICLVVFGCMLLYINPGAGIDVGNCSPSHPQPIQTVAQFQLPPSAKLLESHCIGMQGWGAYAKFEVNPAELDTFIASTRLKPPLSRTVHDWNTEVNAFESYLYGKYEDTSFSQEILIDTRNPEQYIVYVCVIGGD